MASAPHEQTNQAGPDRTAPECRPTAMPAQEFQFWTPRLAAAALLRQLRQVRGAVRLRGQPR